MNGNLEQSAATRPARAARLGASIVGFAALVWFLLRVIPKPSRATYPCQRAAFPVASAFVLWLCGSVAGLCSVAGLRRFVHRYRWAAAGLCALTLVAGGLWLAHSSAIAAAEIAPATTSSPSSVTSRSASLAASSRAASSGRAIPRPPTGPATSTPTPTSGGWTATPTRHAWTPCSPPPCASSPAPPPTRQAWKTIFTYYNASTRGLQKTGYRPGEIVAVKVNLNNSSAQGPDNIVNVSPQVALAMVRQLVNHAHVHGRPTSSSTTRAATSIPALLTKIWSEFKDVRFVQADPPDPGPAQEPRLTATTTAWRPPAGWRE